MVQVSVILLHTVARHTAVELAEAEWRLITFAVNVDRVDSAVQTGCWVDMVRIWIWIWDMDMQRAAAVTEVNWRTG